MRGAALVLGILMLSACTDVQQAVDETARQGTRGIVAETLITQFPQVPKELITAFTDCIVANAQAAEVRELARAAVVGVNETTVTTITNVLARPETVQCLRTNAPGSGFV